MKKKLLVSFSGGETSAYMAQWLWKNKQEEYEMVFVFANTGQEHEATLEFIEKCSKYFGFPVIWVKALVNSESGKGTTHKIVDFKTANRDGQVFENVIAKYGIPNQATKHCNRELKLNPLKSYMRAIGWRRYFSAIGIRSDEIDRVNEHRVKNRLLYPLVTNKPMTKPKINFWWKQQPFRLELKGYQGNCKWDFPQRMEKKYENFIPETRLKLMTERGDEIKLPTRFFRKNRSVLDLVKEATQTNKQIRDDSQVFDFALDLFDLLEEEESCDIHSECGS